MNNLLLSQSEINEADKPYNDLMGKKFVIQNSLDTKLPSDYSYNSMKIHYTCLETINDVEKFKELRVLDIYASGKFIDLSHIRFPKSLINLSLWRSGIEKINLDGLNLDELHLCSNKLKNIEINFSVKKLDLSYNQIENLDFSNNQKLVWCNLADNPLKAVNFKGCVNIENISLENCGLHINKDMFDGCNNLQWLFLKGNYVDANTVAALQRKFPNCNIFAVTED